jgi:hypothetical protein
MPSSYSYRRANLIAKPWCGTASRSQSFALNRQSERPYPEPIFFAFQPQRVVLPQNSFQPPGKSTHFTFDEPSRHSGTVWHCGTVALWHCGTVALWHCGTVALWHCGTVEGLNYNSVNTHIIKVGLLPIFRLFVLIILHRPLNHRAALAFRHINRKVGVFLALRAQQEHRVR